MSHKLKQHIKKHKFLTVNFNYNDVILYLLKSITSSYMVFYS